MKLGCQLTWQGKIHAEQFSINLGEAAAPPAPAKRIVPLAEAPDVTPKK